MSAFLGLETLKVAPPGREPWDTTILDLPRGITPTMAAHGQSIVESWVKVFPHEDTWVAKTHGVPSLLVRLDCVPTTGKSELQCFEVEDRPQALGLALRLNMQLHYRFEKVRPHWPKRIISVSAEDRRGGDDYLWATEVTLEEALADHDSIVLTRCEPHQEQFWELADRSIAPIRTEGYKGYGATLGWWQRVTAGTELPGVGSGYCLKPLYGSKAKDVMIVHPQCGPGSNGHKALANGRKVGGWSRNQAANHLAEHRQMYLQPFIAPIEEHIGQYGAYNHMYRIFYAFNPTTREWVCLGGLWFARPAPQLLLHGAKDAIIGPVVIL